MKHKMQQKTNTKARATLGTLLTGQQRNVCSTVTVWSATELSTSHLSCELIPEPALKPASPPCHHALASPGLILQ